MGMSNVVFIGFRISYEMLLQLKFHKLPAGLFIFCYMGCVRLIKNGIDSKVGLRGKVIIVTNYPQTVFPGERAFPDLLEFFDRLVFLLSRCNFPKTFCRRDSPDIASRSSSFFR